MWNAVRAVIVLQNYPGGGLLGEANFPVQGSSVQKICPSTLNMTQIIKENSTN